MEVVVRVAVTVTGASLVVSLAAESAFCADATLAVASATNTQGVINFMMQNLQERLSDARPDIWDLF